MATQSNSDSRGLLPCRYYFKGGCRYGNGCPYSHEVQRAIAPETIPLATDHADDWSRTIGGAVVEFEHGAAVSKLSLHCDFSAVRLTGLPREASETSVTALLKELRIEERNLKIRISPSPAVEGTCSAEIKAESPTFAKTLCSKTEPLRLRHIDAVPVDAFQTRMMGLTRLDCRKVICSWHRPVKLAWLNFGNKDIASKVQSGFESGVYKILDRKVSASSPTGSTGAGQRFNRQGITVALSLVPGLATKNHVLCDIPKHLQPRNISLGEPSYVADFEAACATVKSMVQQIGPLEWSEDSASTGSKRAKLQARFLDDTDAQQAVAILNDAPLSFATKAKLTLQLVTSAKFRVKEKKYSILQYSIETHKQEWEKQHIRYTVYDPDKGHRGIKIEGHQKDDVAKAVVTLGKIFSGRPAKQNDEPLWTPAFTTASHAYTQVKELQQELGVFIERDLSKSVLRLFGPEPNCKRAEMRISKIIQENSASRKVIDLSPSLLGWARRGGLMTLRAALGSNIADLDNPLNPKCILISGSQDDRARAAAILESQDPSAVLQLDSGDDADCCCSVCWTAAEDPLRTRCGHLYCGDCFENLCRSYSSPDASPEEFRIACRGEEDRCGAVFELGELEENLPSDVLEELLEASFRSHVARRPDLYRHCPGPDCGYLYRTAGGGGGGGAVMHTCPGCLTTTCTGCHDAHAGMSCAEHKDLVSGGAEANRQLMRKLGIKECPRYGIAIEKTEGCNHMMCKSCRAHICWKCMHNFESSEACYDHLRKHHGGVFDYPE
ncbi:hypothetical protein TruAng_011017 [Truncatella angustata]|nr:hypothetical protein TruAng_011017 [Truncatella angustata]